jgi:hypothetical protein
MPNQTFGTTSGSLGDTARRGIDEIGDAGRRVVEDTAGAVRSGLTKTVQYFRENDARAIGGDVKSYLKSHPTQALIGAAVLGVIAGRMMRRG